MISTKPLRPSLLTSNTPVKLTSVFSPRSQGKKVFFSQIKSERLFDSYIIPQPHGKANNININGSKSKHLSERKNEYSLERGRQKSVNFKNDLFKQLACKMKQSRQQKSNLKQSVISDYYDNDIDKQNKKQSMNILRKEDKTKIVYPHTLNKITNEHNKQKEKYKIQQKGSRYIKVQNATAIDDYEMVRTSEAAMQLKITNARGSLDMSPNI